MVKDPVNDKEKVSHRRPTGYDSALEIQTPNSDGCECTLWYDGRNGKVYGIRPDEPENPPKHGLSSVTLAWDDINSLAMPEKVSPRDDTKREKDGTGLAMALGHLASYRTEVKNLDAEVV